LTLSARSVDKVKKAS